MEGVMTPIVLAGLLAAPRHMTLAECVDLANRRNPEVLSAAEDVEAAEAGRAGAAGGFGPRLRAEGNVIRWNEAQEVTLTIPGAPTPPSFTARDATTWGTTVSVIQPLGALWSVYEGYRLKDLGVDVARIRRETTRRDTAYLATEAFYRLLQAARLGEVAATSVEQLEAQVRRAQSFHERGLVAENDVLRAELGLADARQRLIQARGGVTLARARLALALGLPPDTVIEPDAPDEAPPRPTPAVEEAERRALASRVELREVEASIAQASSGVRAAWSRMLPQVNLVGAYQHNEGQQFLAADAAYVGAFASWDVWEWGSTYRGTDEARARLRQALLAAGRVRDGVLVEARTAHVGVATAEEALAVARQAVTQAEENFRIESRRYEANANTSFDVLDAEAQLTQARGRAQTSLYDVLIARAALARAMGETP
jgi:outer membrane protein